MHQRKPGTLGGSFSHSPLEIGRLKTDVSMDAPFTFPWQYKFVNESGHPAAPCTRVPQRKTEILLSVLPEKMSAGDAGKFLRHRHAVSCPTHCVSHKRHMWPARRNVGKILRHDQAEPNSLSGEAANLNRVVEKNMIRQAL